MTRIGADLHEFLGHSVGNPKQNEAKIRANPPQSVSSVFQWYRIFPKRKLLQKSAVLILSECRFLGFCGFCGFFFTKSKKIYIQTKALK
jgi:hypothetical protein